MKRSPKPNLRLLDNILVVLRHMCQTPDLAALLHEPSVFVSTITDVVSEFMSVTEALLNDMSFLSTGPSYRLKTAINYSVILQKISDGFSSSRQEYVAYLGLSDISEVVRNSDDGSPEKSRYIGVLNMHGFTGIDRSGTIKLPAWDKPARRAALGYLKEWYSTTHEVSSVMSISPENSKMNKLRLRLIRRIGAACEKIFNIGNPFEGEVSQDLIIWMAKMESSGFRVFTPEVLYTHDNALGTVLAHSYRWGWTYEGELIIYTLKLFLF